ncbi:hypothetical protein BATDEDRAFT_35163 [Batrachochytrium dendrobatidis JAM81]|uniref:Uncharacterized protein n=1 Tax=Batrachochytrium dendrobatidis (strain JAM81 / FGSC 10211) TaxID=684364 RepID=F4P3W1_BATDJ|nr:uncharacterized protein BATDEDRAFT_35163 [Batrachochytrium dendrobatidis JAM81]EGF80545.1 hypothetical protein BATDEDRAFT_35163 [Batrachochytrium dendrobatidis JAM81]|eukprot:XP_006679128.1 hypothetical protein BATDEDRAFT_35163 [Batrachochytrium dendrobatidis JAM81]
MENKQLYIKYLENQPVEIETHFDGELERKRPLNNVSKLIAAIVVEPTRRLAGIPEDYGPITLHFVVDGPAISGNTLLTSIQEPVSSYDHPLIIKAKSNFVRSKSDQEFIDANNLALQTPNDAFKYLIYHLEKIVNVSRFPNNAVFHDNCLEHRLDRRSTSYAIDDVNNVKLFLAVSGAGKTRMLLELLYSNFGYYFTSKSSQDDFGSKDMYECRVYCDSKPELTKHAIQLLYFVRVSVCNYLISKGFKEPWQILLAQLHPIAFFGLDLFERLFTILVKDPGLSPTAIINPFPFTAIDEIQALAEGLCLHYLPESKNLRPFFSPFVYHSKMMGIFPHFLLSGTGINFESIKELMESSVMKDGQVTDYVVISKFHPLKKLEVEQYARQFLQDHQVDQLDAIVSRISDFELCHGRPRFVSYILDAYMKSNDIDTAISKFITGISDVDGQIFPLRFLKDDLDKNIRSFDRVIDGDTLSRIIRDAFLDAIWKGKMQLNVTGNDVANHSGPDAANSIKASRASASSYLLFGDSSQVYFPDHMCGPDIIYKCANTKTVYIVQIKFVKRMSKQEAANAYNTTDPERFYCKRNGGGVSKKLEVLKGFEEERTYLLSTLSELHESGYSLQQTLVIHTAEKNPVDAQDMRIINSQNSPQFFDKIGNGVWDFLNLIRNNLQ